MSTATLQIEKTQAAGERSEVKKTLVPQLRFQEFDEEWKEEELGNITKVTSGGTPSRNNMSFWNGNIPWITTSLINFDVINTAEEYITEEAVLKSSAKLFQKGTILMAMYGQGKTRGKVAVLGIDATTNQACGAIMPNDDLDKNYLFQNLAGRYDEIRDLSNEGGQQNLSGGIIKAIKVCFPKLPEQQKIASFLSAVDEKIQQLSHKKELLDQYKKGLMQQLFSGKLRFKDEDGNDYSDWEEKKLGEVGELKNGLNKDKKDFGVGSPFVNLMDVFGKTEIYNQEFGLVNSNDKEKVLYNLLKGDVLFIRSSVKRSGVGGTVVVQEDLINTVYSGFLIRFRDDRKSLAQEFKKYCFSAQSFRDEILSYATSSANTNINQESLNKINLNLPCIEEQQKIAAFLFSIDVKIESTNQQINQTQSFKKGLLQQLFV